MNIKYKIIFCSPIKSENQIKYSQDNFFYFGSNSINKKNVFNLQLNDCYENLALKMLLGYQQLNNLDFDYVFKFDSDTYLNLENITKINLEDSNYGFICEGNTFKKPQYNKLPLKIDTKFPLGGGYILTKQTVNILSQKKYEDIVRDQIKNNICTFEDVMVGKIIQENKLPLINNGYWIDKSKWCYSSCFDIFYHSTNEIPEPDIKKIIKYLKRK